MSSVRFREATPDDADAVAAYHHRCVTNTFATLIESGELVPPNVASTRQQLRDWFEVDAAIDTTIAVVDGTPVAHVTVAEHQVVHLFVDPAHQGGGLGRTLLERAEASIAVAGHTRFELHVRVENTRAIAFYARAGWTMTDERITTVEHGITYDEHVMEKRRL